MTVPVFDGEHSVMPSKDIDLTPFCIAGYSCTEYDRRINWETSWSQWNKIEWDKKYAEIDVKFKCNDRTYQKISFLHTHLGIRSKRSSK